MTTETVEPKNETPSAKELSQDELLARGWAALPADYRIPDVAPTLEEAQAWCKALAESHYENFHVASWFLPKDLRPHFHSIYAYCRVSDDLGDEVGDPEQALALLDQWGRELDACYEGRTRHPVFCALASTGWHHRRTLVHHSASPAGLVLIASRPEGRQTFLRRRGNQLARQQSGIGVAYRHGPRARLPQPLSPSGRGDASDRRADGDDLQSESIRSRNRFTGVKLNLLARSSSC